MPDSKNKEIHRLLNRQLRRHLGVEDLSQLPENLHQFVNAINEAYTAADHDHEMMERSFEISSEELIRAKTAAEKAMVARQEFFANMSHEIRTPMNGVIGVTDILLELDLQETHKKYVKIIKDSATALLTVINDILDFSKIEAGKLSITPQVFSLKERLLNIEAIFSSKLSSSDLILITEIAKNVPENLFGDIDRITQILMNLIGNSLKFTEPGGAIVVYVETNSQVGDDIELLFYVIDTGIGIPQERLSDIFDPFIQVSDSKRRQVGGTGLGLSISSQLVSRMGGNLSAQSIEGVGSVFNFSLKLQIAQTIVEQSSVNREEKDRLQNSDRKLTVLVAEDNTINQLVIRNILERSGHKVTIAPNGEKAVELVKAQEFDIVLMDIQMPVLDGVSACKIIRSIEGGKKIPIVAVTAHAMQGDREHYLKIGMDDYISKPIDRNALNLTIKRLTNQ